jgi:copper chaperone CopZ
MPVNLPSPLNYPAPGRRCTAVRNLKKAATSTGANIEGDLASEPGVEQVTVDVGTQRVRIAYDERRTSPGQLRARLREIGYRAAH